MTTKDEALALALEALEEHDGNYAQSNASAARVNAAITAIKQAQQAEPMRQFIGDSEPDTLALLADLERVDAKSIKQALPEQASRMIAPAYGIIDPDYARVFTQARIVAWQYGYACVMHGSFTRDLDLLLVPWTDNATGNEDQLLKLIAQGCGLRFIDCKEEVVFSTVDWSEKPHGRKACSLYFPAFGDRRWIDISIFTKPQAHQAQEPTWTDGCTEENCLRCKTHPKHRGNMQHAGIGSYPPAPKQAEPAWQPIETAPFGVQLLVTAEFDGPNDWRIKVGDKDAHGHWIVYGASWKPTHWMPLPTPPEAKA